MPYRLLVDVTVLVHLLFIGYVVAGGFLAWRWRRTIWLHVAAAAWAAGIVAAGFDCPLTYLENWARARGGEPPLPSDGFIAHYLTGVVYPADATTLVQVLVAVCVLVSWIGFARLRGHVGSPP
ncbi:DUF2784 domain-containing protein [Prescottella subtropica]|uniref:DUF2784 domain-containing protein n=1 Tax=Prescottella subtropica TaxID=2545757 RepID=UPI0010F9ABC3|nr:DUF2784 domain-containing protein [Prescottella subtropica]